MACATGGVVFHRVLDARNHDSPADVWAFVVQVIVAHRGDRSDQVIVFGVCGVGGNPLLRGLPLAGFVAVPVFEGCNEHLERLVVATDLVDKARQGGDGPELGEGSREGVGEAENVAHGDEPPGLTTRRKVSSSGASPPTAKDAPMHKPAS